MANKNLNKAKKAKNDEFYTLYHDIEKEVSAYLEYDKDVFRNKTILCPCDSFQSNFTKYFISNFKSFGLKKLICTCYIESSRGRVLTITDDNMDANWVYLQGDGDFRSNEVTALRDEADIIITNPPFSLFCDFLSWIFVAQKQFLIIGNMNAITCKEVFPLIKDNRMWLGNGFTAGNAYFATPSAESYQEGVYQKETGLVKFRNCCWFSNIDHGKRHKPLPLMTIADNLKFSKHKELRNKGSYDKYDNYNAIEVSYTDSIPSDYQGIMGVPISFLDKYCPEQFEISGITDRQDSYGFRHKKYTIEDHPKFNDLNARGVIKKDGQLKSIYARILIKHKNPVK